MNSKGTVLFETEGQLLSNRRAPLFLAIGALGTFGLSLAIFQFVCVGFGVALKAVVTLFSACLLGFFGNLVLWRAVQGYKVWVTDKELILVPTGVFSKKISVAIHSIEQATVLSQKMHGAEAKVVSLKVKDRLQPIRCLVSDPEGLMSALNLRSASMAR